MKELCVSVINAYNDYRGTGKLLALFLVSVLIIYLINRLPNRSGVSPFYFILSPVTGIGYAFSMLYAEGCSAKGDIKNSGSVTERKPVKKLLVCFLLALVLILSGQWVFSPDDHYAAENFMHIKAEDKAVFDTLLSKDEGVIRVMASPEISPYMKAYSKRFDVMFGYPDKGEPAGLSEDERYVYEQMSLSTPNEGETVKRIKKLGYEYIVYDREKTYMELPLEEFGYELIAEVSGYLIYRDAGYGTDAGLEGSVLTGILIPAVTGACGLALFIFCSVSFFSQLPGKPGKKRIPLAFVTVILILLQTVGAAFFAYDKPAALPSYICGQASLTVIYTILPFVMIPAYYGIYILLARELIKDAASVWFMIFSICMLNLFGYQSDAFLPVTMLYDWFSWQALIVHGVLPFLLLMLIRYAEKDREDNSKGTVKDGAEENYYIWEDEDMKNHKIINARTVAIALLIVVMMLIGSVYIMNRKINSLYDTTVNLQKQVEELKQENQEKK